tara:strand:+ start:641 stop:802 length:162 start_codon:yes stop_codon:yes gene_type:complete
LSETALSEKPPAALDNTFESVERSMVLGQHDELSSTPTDPMGFGEGIPVEGDV